MIASIVEKKALSKQFFCEDSLDEQEKKGKNHPTYLISALGR